MAAHLRPLPKCRTCGKPATQALHNGMNANTGEFCELHAKMALKDFQRKYESEKQDASRR